MAVLQHYYTSFVNRESGTAGFQVKAMSPGISADTQSKIARLIAYRIPSTLNEQDITTHPVALRYYYVGPQECILLCSQSNGTDENGRPGNFFAHTLVMEPGMFASVPPILYWRSPFWRTRDAGSSASIAPLPSFEEDPSLGIEGIWGFLAQGSRIEQFHKLMCAVVHHNVTKRRIVIVDTADNVAMWVAAVSCMLPPDYRPLLSFATYHHDPYQSQFMITGTTSDSSFRASQEEYMSYFILNAETGRVSDVEDSPYAALVKRAAQSMDTYDTELLPLFADSMRRFPPSQEIGEQLDLMVLYFNVLHRRQQVSLHPPELKSIDIALMGFERLRPYEEEDLQALSQLGIAISALYRLQAQSDTALVEIYKRVVCLLKEQNLFSTIVVKEDLLFHAQVLAQGQDFSAGGIAELVQVHGLQAVTEAANTPALLGEVNRLLRKQYRDPRAVVALQLIWTYLGPYIQPVQQSLEFMLVSLEILGQMWKDKRADDASALIEEMVRAMNGREREWLMLAVADYDRLTDNRFLLSYYYNIVSQMRLEQRVPYRLIVQRANPDIASYELKHDLARAASSTERISCFEQWIEHAQGQRIDVTALMHAGLKTLEKAYAQSPRQWGSMASQILTSRVLAPLLSEWEDRLVDTALVTISFSRHTPSDIVLCKKYEHRAGLSHETRTVIAGLLAMSSGHLDQELASRLQVYFRNFSKRRPEAYKAEVSDFVSGFLPKCDSPVSHEYLFTACCDLDFDLGDAFWPPYWKTLKSVLTNAFAVRQSLSLLSFWFAAQPDALPSYVVPFFFLAFPRMFDEVRKTRGFQDVAREMNDRAMKQKLKWYPLLHDLFGERKNVLVSMGQSMGYGLKRLVNQGDEEAQRRAQAEAQMFEESIAQLFEGKRLGDTQRRKFPTVYSWEQRERFWESYWEKFVKLVAHDADQTLDLLSFWFDESFTTWVRTPYGPESFFLGLQDALQVARKERGFQETARQINAKVQQKGSTYQWYPLVEAYFEVRGSRFPWGR